MSRNYIRLKQIEPTGLASLVRTGDTGIYNDIFLGSGYSGLADEKFYLATNPSGYITTGEASGSITGYAYPRHENPSGYTSTGEVTGSITGYAYPLHENPSGYVTTGETGALTGSFAQINHAHQLASLTGDGFLSSGLYNQIRCVESVNNLSSAYRDFFPTLRLESPSLNGTACPKTVDTDVVVLGGESGQEYTVNLRLRGVYETKYYEGGEALASGAFVAGNYLSVKKGGVPAETPHNLMKLIIGEGDGEVIYYLNHEETPCNLVSEPVDLTFSIQVTGRSKVRLSMDSVDGQQLVNTSLSVSGIKPYPEPYVGQFFQIDVVDVSDICYLDSKFEDTNFENPNTCSGDYENIIPDQPGEGSADIASFFATEGGFEAEVFEEYVTGSIVGYSIIYGGANYAANSSFRMKVDYDTTGNYTPNADTAYEGEPIVSGYTNSNGTITGLFVEYAGSGISGISIYYNDAIPPIWDYGTHFETLGGYGAEGKIDLKRDLSRLDLIHDGGFDGDVYDILIDGNDIYVGGDFDRYANIPSPRIAKINARGIYDFNFKAGCGFSRKVTKLKKSTTGDYIYASANKIASYKNSNPSEFVLKIDSSGSLVTGFDCPETVSDQYNRLISMAVISGDDASERLAVLSPNTLTILDGSDGSLIEGVSGGASGTYRFNSLYSHDKKLILSSAPYTSYSSNIGQKYNDQLYPLSLRLLSTGDSRSIDSIWAEDDEAGTGGQSSCGDALFFETGSYSKGYYIVGNTANLTGDAYFNSAGTSWNAAVLGNYLLYSEQFDESSVWVQSAAGVSVTPNTDLAPGDNQNDQNSADTITDNSFGVGGNIGYITQTIDLPSADNETYIFSIYVKKQEIATTAAEFRFDLYTDTDSFLAGYSVKFNAETGAYSLLDNEGSITPSAFVQLLSLSNSPDDLYWRLSCYVQNAVLASKLSVQISPAAYPLNSTTKRASEGGSIVVFGAQLIKSTWQNIYDRTLSKTTTSARIPAYPPIDNNKDNFRGLYKISESGRALSSGFNCNIELSDASASHVIPFFIDQDQKIYIGGPIISIDGTSVDSWKLYRLNSDGSLDKVYDQFNGRVSVARLTSCGNIAVGGRFTAYGSRKLGRFVIIDRDGNIVDKFGSGSDDVLVSASEPDTTTYPCYKDKIWLDNSGDARLLKTWDESISGWSGPNYIGKLTKVAYSPFQGVAEQGAYYTFNSAEASLALSVTGYPSAAIYYESGSGISLSSIQVPNPTTGSKLYTTPISVENTGDQNIYFSFKAISRLEFYSNSDVSASNYLVTPQLPQVDFTPDDGAPKTVSSITLTVPGHPGSTIYYKVSGIDNNEESRSLANSSSIVSESSYTASGASPLTVSLDSYSTSIAVQAIASKQGYRNATKNTASYWVAGYGFNGQLQQVAYSPESYSTGVFPIEVAPSVIGHPLSEGTIIYYTTDGAEPNYTNSSKLKYPNTAINFDVDADECNGVIKSFATKFLYTSSQVSTGVYIKETYSGAAMSPAGGAVAIGSGIKITGEDLGSDYEAYYSTSEDFATKESGDLYSEESGIRLDNSSEINFYVRVYKTGYCVSDPLSGTYSGAKAPAVTFSPSESEIRFGSDNVTISADGFTIHYETGSQLSLVGDVTASSSSGLSPITLSITEDTAIKAYAVADGYIDGEISEIAYGKGTAPAIVFDPDGGEVKFESNGTLISIIPISSTGAGDSIYFDTGNGFEIYNSSFRINSGYEISGYVVADGLYNGPTGSATFTQKQLSGVTFDPSDSRDHSTFPFSISISTSQDAGIEEDEYSIYYVTGMTGSADTTPSPDDTEYVNPFSVVESGTVVAAIVSGDGYLPSETGVITYLLPKLGDITFDLNN